MKTSIKRILKAGECSEVVIGSISGRISANHPSGHDFTRYPIYTNDPNGGRPFCPEHYEARFIVTVEGLGFTDIFSVFADEEIELVSLTERVSMKVVNEKSVMVKIVPI